MAEVGGYELSDSTMDDKQAYVDLVWGAKVKRDWTEKVVIFIKFLSCC